MMDKPLESRHPDCEVREAFSMARELMESGDSAEAERMLNDNCVAGCSDSMVLLGCLYAESHEDISPKALGLFIRAADLGNNSGMRNAGYCYALGIGCEQDKREAVRWYRASAESGNAKAQCNLGVMYEFGNGVVKDDVEAAKWFLLSAQNGYSRGQTNIGVLLMEGRGITRDIREAEKWFRMSRTPRASYHLARILMEPDYDGSDRAEAVSILEISAELGYVKAMSLLSEVLADVDEEKSERLRREVTAIQESRMNKRALKSK